MAHEPGVGDGGELRIDRHSIDVQTSDAACVNIELMVLLRKVADERVPPIRGLEVGIDDVDAALRVLLPRHFIDASQEHFIQLRIVDPRKIYGQHVRPLQLQV